MAKYTPKGKKKMLFFLTLPLGSSEHRWESRAPILRVEGPLQRVGFVQLSIYLFFLIDGTQGDKRKKICFEHSVDCSQKIQRILP